MAFRLDVVPDSFDLSVGGYENAAADDPFVRATHEFFRSPKAIGFNHFVVGIAEKREVELVLFLKAREGLDGVRANSKYFHFKFFKLLFCVTKLGRFHRSTGGVRLGKEIEQKALSFQIS